MGVLEAHENSIYLHNLIMQRECGEDDPLAGMLGDLWRWLLEALGGDDGGGGSTRNKIFEGAAAGGSNAEACRRYFQRARGRRYAHLSLMAGDPVATREVAGMMARQEYPFDGSGGAGGETRALTLHAYNAVQGDVHSLMYLGWALWTGAVPGGLRAVWGTANSTFMN